MVPAVNPVTVNGEAAPDAVSESGELVAVHEVMEAPFPLLIVKATLTEVTVANVAVPMVGLTGVPAATKAVEAEEGVDVPTALVAVQVNVYEVPDVKPVMTTGEAAADADREPGFDRHEKEVIVDPPLELAVKGTEAWRDVEV